MAEPKRAGVYQGHPCGCVDYTERDAEGHVTKVDHLMVCRQHEGTKTVWTLEDEAEA